MMVFGDRMSADFDCLTIFRGDWSRRAVESYAGSGPDSSRRVSCDAEWREINMRCKI